MAEEEYQSIHPPEVVQMEHDNPPPSPLSDVPTTPNSAVQLQKPFADLSDNDEICSIDEPPHVSRKITPPSAKSRQFQKLPSRIMSQNQTVSSNEDDVSPRKKISFMKKTEAPFDENPITSPNISSIERTLLRLKGHTPAFEKPLKKTKAMTPPNDITSPSSIAKVSSDILIGRKAESMLNKDKSNNTDNAPDDEKGFLSKRNILAEMDEMEDFIINAKSSEVSSPEKESKENPRKETNGIPLEIRVNVSTSASSEVGPRDEEDEVMARKPLKLVDTNKDKTVKINEDNDGTIEVTVSMPSPSRDEVMPDSGKGTKADMSAEMIPDDEPISIANIEESKVEDKKDTDLLLAVHKNKTCDANQAESTTPSCKGEMIVSKDENIKQDLNSDDDMEQKVSLKGVSLGTVINDAAEAAASSLELFGTSLATSTQEVGEFVMAPTDSTDSPNSFHETASEWSNQVKTSPDRPKTPEEIAAEWRRRKREVLNEARLAGDVDSQKSDYGTKNASSTPRSQDDDDKTKKADNRIIDDLKDGSSNSNFMTSPTNLPSQSESIGSSAAPGVNKASSSGVTGWWLEKELARRDREQKVKSTPIRKTSGATTHLLVETSANEKSTKASSAKKFSQQSLDAPVSSGETPTLKDPQEGDIPENRSVHSMGTDFPTTSGPTRINTTEETGNLIQKTGGNTIDTKLGPGKINGEIKNLDGNRIDNINDSSKLSSDISQENIGKFSQESSALPGVSKTLNTESSIPTTTETANEEKADIKENSTNSEINPTLVSSLDDMDGICKGDLVLSLLHTKGKEGQSSDDGATQVQHALWRTRIMRRRFGSGHRESGSVPLILNDNQTLSPRTQTSRQSLPVDVDDVRTFGALTQVAVLEKSAIEYMRHDDFDGALDLYDDIFYAYTETYINQDKNSIHETADLKKLQSNLYLGNALHNLGIIHFLNHDYKDALSYFLRAEVKRASPNGVPPNSEHLTTLVKIAMCHYALGDFSKAHKGLELCLESAKVHCKTITDFIQIAEILNNLGCLSFMCGESDVSMEMFTESLDVQQSVLNYSLYDKSNLSGHTSSLHVSVTQANMAFLRMCTSDHSMALGLFEAALLTQQVLLYDTHETLMCTMDHLAAANLMHGSQQKAINMLERMLRAQIMVYGKDDARCEITRNKIVMVRSNDDSDKQSGEKNSAENESSAESNEKCLGSLKNWKNVEAKSNLYLDKEDSARNESRITDDLQKRRNSAKLRNAKEDSETKQAQKESVPFCNPQAKQAKPLMAKSWRKLGTSFRLAPK